MTPKKTYYEILSKTIMSNMEKRQMEAYYCEDSQAAVAKVLELIPEGSSISWGGTMTMNEAGIMDALKAGNYELIDRSTAKTPQEQKELFAKTVCSDYFFMGSNAVTMDGELVNIDGNGNRVACLCCGPENVIVLAGMNKVAANVEEAYSRVRNVAAPINALRLEKETPCASKGKCYDCQSPGCICSQIVVTRRSQKPGRIKVILIGEDLGF